MQSNNHSKVTYFSLRENENFPSQMGAFGCCHLTKEGELVKFFYSTKSSLLVSIEHFHIIWELEPNLYIVLGSYSSRARISIVKTLFGNDNATVKRIHDTKQDIYETCVGQPFIFKTFGRFIVYRKKDYIQTENYQEDIGGGYCIGIPLHHNIMEIPGISYPVRLDKQYDFSSGDTRVDCSRNFHIKDILLHLTLQMDDNLDDDLVMDVMSLLEE